MDWETIVEEGAQARRRRIRQLLVALGGDFVGGLGVVLGFIGTLDWMVAVPLIALGWGSAGYMFWQMIFQDRARLGEGSL
jgi:hypothetical protein